MFQNNIQSIIAEITKALEKNDLAGVIANLETLRTADQAEIFSGFEDDQKLAVLPHLKPSQSAALLEELEDEEVVELVSALSQEHALRIVDQMDPNDAADFLGDLPQEQAVLMLAALEKPEDVRPLLLHADDSAGGLMTSEFIALRSNMKAAVALQAIRDWKPDSDDIYYLFVVDGINHLVGVVSLRQLINANPDELLRNFMDTQVIAVNSGTDQEEVARLIARYDLLSLPVIDQEGNLIGLITVDDVIDVIEEETTEDMQRLGGSVPLERAYLNTGALTITKKRIGWLLLLFVTESLTGTVLRHFEGELASVVALSFFIPLLIGTGGNAGSQTTSTIIRALAVGDINLGDAFQTLWHELRIGLMLGLGMSAFAYLRALTWGSSSALALTVSVSILAIVIWANVLGAILPLLAGRLKIDPTVVSGPVMSTLVDATGLFIYFTIAKVLIGL